MKRAAIFVVLGFLACACSDSPTAPTPIPQGNSQNQTVNVVIGQQPGSGGGATCTTEDPPATFLEITGPDSVGVNAEVLVNATPKPTASDGCNRSRGITWNLLTPATCGLGGERTSFTPKITGGPGQGQCCVQGYVPGATSVFCLRVGR